jgi:hypothetical protein
VTGQAYRGYESPGLLGDKPGDALSYGDDYAAVGGVEAEAVHVRWRRVWRSAH